MTVLLVLATIIAFLVVDYLRSRDRVYAPLGTQFTTPGFEMLGALAQDGGEVIGQNDWEI